MTKPYCIGSDDWNGLSKVIEEIGELGQVCGKLIGSEGNDNHWSGNLKEKFIEELADVQASIDFFITENFSEEEIDRILDRIESKVSLFKKWNEDIKNGRNSKTS